MKSRKIRLGVLATFCLLPMLLTLCTPPIWARLFPPVWPISYSLTATDAIRYSVIDPISTQIREETWTIPQGIERTIESIQSDEGILSWIDKYKNPGDGYFTYVVQYRIYDPGRVCWRAGSWGPFSGYDPQLGQHQVVDGVVALTSRRRLGPNPSDELEHQVLYATYEPGFGSWSLGYQQWRVKDLSGPEVLRVKNGVVSWPMKNAGGRCSDEWNAWIWAVTFDHEIKQWIQTDRDFMFGWPAGCSINVFDWIEIMSDTAQVNIRGSSAPCTKNFYFNYDGLLHKWKTLEDDPGTPIRRAYFLAWPDWGVVPFWTWFWDLSIGLEPPSAGYLWNLTPTNTSTDRSPAFRYTTAGFYDVVQNITYNSPPAHCFQGQVSALAPGPTGSININNDAAYTSSYSVTLSLRYEPTAVEMRFKQVPGLAIWGDWEPVAPTRAWTLSGKYVGDFPDGTHTVYVQYRTYWGVQGAESGDSIELDITPPAGTLTLNGGALRTNNPVVQAVWSASDFYPGMQMSYSYYSQEDGFGIWSHWQSYSPTTRNFTFSGLGGIKTVLVRFKDAGGNITQKEANINMDWHTFLPLLRRP